MEEKKYTKISLSTFFLILAIITIVIMGGIIYKINNDKISEINKSSELQTKVINLETQANESQEKINNLSQTINSYNTNTTNNESKTYAFSNVAGEYQGTSNDNEENADRHYTLYLFENGTFLYENYIDILTGKIGNYTIVDNTIILNYWFQTHSDASLDVITGQKTLHLNSNNSIKDSNPENSNSSNVILNKVPVSEETEKDTIINHSIDNCKINNKFKN